MLCLPGSSNAFLNNTERHKKPAVRICITAGFFWIRDAKPDIPDHFRLVPDPRL